MEQISLFDQVEKPAVKPARPAPAKEPAELKPAGKRGRKSFREMDEELVRVQLPDEERLFEKQYYPIGTVAEWFGVNPSLLRYWENEFDLLKPRKNRKGDRLFRPEDVQNLRVIYWLLRERKFTIEGAKEYLKINRGTADVRMQVSDSLNRLKGFLLELRASL